VLNKCRNPPSILYWTQHQITGVLFPPSLEIIYHEVIRSMFDSENKTLLIVDFVTYNVVSIHSCVVPPCSTPYVSFEYTFCKIVFTSNRQSLESGLTSPSPSYDSVGNELTSWTVNTHTKSLHCESESTLYYYVRVEREKVQTGQR